MSGDQRLLIGRVVDQLCEQRGWRLLGDPDHRVLRDPVHDGYIVRIATTQQWKLSDPFHRVFVAGEVIDELRERLFERAVERITSTLDDLERTLTPEQTEAPANASAMRGFELVGRLQEWLSPGQNNHVLDSRTPSKLSVGDIIGTAPSPDGPLRCGLARVEAIDGHHLRACLSGITAAAGSDYIFVARAIGERIFDRPGTRTIDA